MTRSVFRLPLVATVSLTALVMGTAAQAGSFSIRSGQGAEGLGMAYAGAASGGIGASSQSWNPATITMFPGRNSSWSFTYLKATADYEPTQATRLTVPPVPFTAAGGRDGGTGDVGRDGAFIPSSSSSWQITDQLWLGLTSGAPFGLRSKQDAVYGGQTYGRSARIRTINVAGSIAYKFSDMFSIGAAVQGQYLKARLTSAAGVTPTASSTILDGDALDFGFRVGATLTPWQGGTFGVGYRSSINQDLKGYFLAPGGVFFPIRASLNLPDSIVGGFSQQFNERWQAHVGVEWTNWSRFRRIPIVNENSGQPFTSLNFEYDDSWFFSGGVEYNYNRDVTLRAGVGYELSPVNDVNRTVFISDNDRLWLSIGGSYQWSEKLKLDLGYTYILVNKATVNYQPGHPQFNNVVFRAEAKPDIHIVSLGISYRWDDPKTTAPIAAVSQVAYKN
jgi:long-chain fatty acid transport protein